MSYKYTLYHYNPSDPEYTDNCKVKVYFVSKHNTIQEAFQGVIEYTNTRIRRYKPIVLSEQDILKKFNNGEKFITLTSQYKDEGEVLLSRESLTS